MEIAEKHRKELPRLKEIVRNSHMYWQPNVKRYNEFRKFVFDTAITDEEQALLLTLKKPTIEFNISETFISRLRGEFFKQQPAITVMPEDGAQVDEETIKVVEDHLRHAISEANSDNCEYDVYTDLLSGGFSVIKIWTEYAHDMSFNQCIKFGRAYDPTLCGFDPMARYAHKGDGRYCYEFYPKSKEEFAREYPDVDINGFSFTRNFAEDDFNWSYKNQKEAVVIICDFYEKKKRKKKIVLLANGQTLTEKQYEKFVEHWTQSGMIAQPPAVVQTRVTTIETICRYRICENQVLEYVETDFKYLPLIFVDGNSILIRDKGNNAVQQMTRPYIYHCKGAQKLKNFAGQTLAAEIENMVTHKFKVAKESIPDEEQYQEAYTNMQIASTFVYNAFMDNDPDKAIPPPMEIQRVAAPPEVTGAFQLMDSLFQTILGSYDAALGINDNELSGVAIVEAATQSNSAAMPYVVGFLQAWNQLAKSYVSLLPKYYSTPRTIPVMNKEGKRTYKKINNPNDQNSVNFNYDDNALQVKVAAGPSFSVQKTRALQQIVALTKASPLFEQFMAEQGLDILLDNMEFKGSEIVKEKAIAWMKQLQQQKAQAAQQPNPEMIKAQVEQAKIQQKDKETQLKLQTHKIQTNLDYARLDFDKQKMKSDEKKTHLDAVIELDKLHTDKVIAAMETAHNFHEHKLKRESQSHTHEMDKYDRAAEHELRKDEKNEKNEKE